jgi:hypothetical protein
MIPHGYLLANPKIMTGINAQSRFLLGDGHATTSLLIERSRRIAVHREYMQTIFPRASAP